MITTEVLIFGAGAAGLFCAIEAGKRHRKTIVIDHANKPGKKILMSGGGRCNFTNLHVSPDKYLSHNPHFCKSALSRYTQWDFIELVKKHRIAFHEKTLGQLFCDEKSKAILEMLLQECQQAQVAIHMDESCLAIEQLAENQFKVETNKNTYICQSIVIATGGLSIPTLGASNFGYKVAEQFQIPLYPLRAGLVPLTLHTHDKEQLATLAGIAQDCIATAGDQSFKEALLFTHRGLSGPAILQISNYWTPGNPLEINLVPGKEYFKILTDYQKSQPKVILKNILEKDLPKRLIPILFNPDVLQKTLANIPKAELEAIASQCQQWIIHPNGTEGYRTAEVTLGGVDCNALSSKTLEVNKVKGLYFIGEVVDVTGWLGGYNFQWAWSSGWAAGQVV